MPTAKLGSWCGFHTITRKRETRMEIVVYFGILQICTVDLNITLHNLDVLPKIPYRKLPANIRPNAIKHFSIGLQLGTYWGNKSLAVQSIPPHNIGCSIDVFTRNTKTWTNSTIAISLSIPTSTRNDWASPRMCIKTLREIYCWRMEKTEKKKDVLHIAQLQFLPNIATRYRGGGAEAPGWCWVPRKGCNVFIAGVGTCSDAPHASTI